MEWTKYFEVLKDWKRLPAYIWGKWTAGQGVSPREDCQAVQRPPPLASVGLHVHVSSSKYTGIAFPDLSTT